MDRSCQGIRATPRHLHLISVTAAGHHVGAVQALTVMTRMTTGKTVNLSLRGCLSRTCSCLRQWTPHGRRQVGIVFSYDIKAVRCHRCLSCAFVDPVSCIAPHRPGVQRLARTQTETRTDIRPRAQRLLRGMMTSSQTCWKNKCTPTSGVSTPVNRD